MAEDPAPAETEPGAGTAANKMEPRMSMQMGVARGGTDVTPLGNEMDGATPAGKKKAPFTETLWANSPVWLPYDPKHRVVSGMEDGGNLILNEHGDPLHDEDGNLMYEPAGWRVKRDQFSRVCSDDEGQLSFDRVDEDRLALMTRTPPGQAQESLVEQVQRLQAELEGAQHAHQTDVGCAEQMMAQAEAQNAADMRAMATEHHKSLRDAKATNDQAWTTWTEQLQLDQAQTQKGITDDFTRRITELQ